MKQQRGAGLIALILAGGAVVMVAMVVMRIIPTLVEYQAVSQAAKRAAQGSTVAEVRSRFDKAATIEDIHSIQSKDLRAQACSQWLPACVPSRAPIPRCSRAPWANWIRRSPNARRN